MRKSPTLMLIALIAFSAFDCNKNNNDSLETKSMEKLHAENGVPVKTEIVKAVPFGIEYSYHSVLTGFEETTASAMVSDKVEKIHFRVGDRISKDTIVVTFPTDNPAAQYFQAKVAYEHAETTLKRIKNLYENGGISLQELDNATTQYEVANANWNAVQQIIAVKAPISGILMNIAVRESDNVEPGDKLFTISKTQKLKTRIWASEHQIEDIAVGNAAKARWQGIELQGKVVQVDMSIDSSKQAYRVVIEFDNTENHMMSGVNAEVIIKGKQDADTIITARKNILNDGESHYIFLAENGLAIKREVILGRNKDLDVEVIEGLEPGEILITEGQMLLENNMKIDVIN